MTARGPARWLFDAWSTFYDQPAIQRLTYRPVQDAVVAALQPLRPRCVLDLGCGTGLLTARLRGAFPATTIVGCDFSDGMLRQAHAREPGVPWVCGDALRLPFRDVAFDAIVSTEAFHWFPDQPRALAEMRRVLVPGGHALIAIVNTPHETVRTLVHAASRTFGQPFDWPTSRQMRTLFEAAGLHVAAQRRVYRLPAGILLPPVLTIGMRPATPRD
jgi:ubiquinone/menaquinone biosynthesis C-methylase UbiE